MTYTTEHSEYADDVRKERKEDPETVKKYQDSWENMKMEYSILKEEEPVFDDETRKESLDNPDYDESDRMWAEWADTDEEMVLYEEDRDEESCLDDYGEEEEPVFDEETEKESLDNDEGYYTPDFEEEPQFDDETRKESMENDDLFTLLDEKEDDYERNYRIDPDYGSIRHMENELPYGAAEMEAKNKGKCSVNGKGILTVLTCVFAIALLLENLYLFFPGKHKGLEVYDVKETYFEYEPEIETDSAKYRTIRKIKINDDITLEISEEALRKIR